MASLTHSAKIKPRATSVVSIRSQFLLPFWVAFIIAFTTTAIPARSFAGATSGAISACTRAIQPDSVALRDQLSSALKATSVALKTSSHFTRSEAHQNFSKYVREMERLRFAEAQTEETLQQRAAMQRLQEAELEKLKGKIEFRMDEPVSHFEFERVINDHSHAVQWKLTVVFESNMRNEVGEIYYTTRGHHFEIISFDIMIAQEFRQIGASLVLASKALEDNPQTQRIDSSLVVDNKRAYMNAIYKDHLRPDQAIQETPAFRMRGPLGYVIDLRESTLPGHPNENSIIRMNAVRADLAHP
jgi:hypothetical protein